MLNMIKAMLRDSGGNFAMMTAIMAIPVFGGVAGAIDYSMASRARTVMQASLDASLLAAGRAEGSLTDKQRTAEAFLTVELGDLNVSNKILEVSASGQGLTGELTATYKPFMLSILGIDKIDLAVESEVVAGSDVRLDVALVLDNTASLGADGIAAVRTAAQNFRDTVFTAVSDPTRVQMAVVPFAGAVNVGRDFPRSQLDVGGQAPHHARRMENMWIAQVAGCALDPQVPPDPGGGEVESLLINGVKTIQNAFAELFGVRPAQAGVPQDHGLPPGYVMSNVRGCDNVQTPPMINNFDLFNGISNVDWAGCVEARADGFDTTDQPGTPGNPASLFVPFFWPDEHDDIIVNKPTFTNDYMTDEATVGVPPWTPASWATWDGWGRTLSPTKYTGRPARLITGDPNTSGPNRGCPRPLTPLTNISSTVESAIDGMQLVDGGGTIVSEGAAWGWRVLSPAAPFQQASSDSKTKRMMVIMSDGENQFSRNPRDTVAGLDYRNGATVSDYNAYGYLRGSRFGNESTFESAQAEVDKRTLQVCANAKADGIEIYTVLFRSSSASAIDTLRRCATSANHHFYLAADADQLNTTFENIAAAIGRYRLVK